jgi:ribonuclease P protein component
MGLPSEHRMTRPSEFLAVRTEGRARSGKWMTVAFLADPTLAQVRFGFTVTKRVGNAVKRNLVRRRLREITRHALPHLKRCGRIVTIPRPIAVQATFAELEVEWQVLAAKLQLIPPPVGETP